MKFMKNFQFIKNHLFIKNFFKKYFKSLIMNFQSIQYFLKKFIKNLQFIKFLFENSEFIKNDQFIKSLIGIIFIKFDLVYFLKNLINLNFIINLVILLNFGFFCVNLNIKIDSTNFTFVIYHIFRRLMSIL